MSSPDVLCLSIEDQQLALIALSGGGVERRAAVPVPSRPNCGHPEVPPFLFNLRLKRLGTGVELIHGAGRWHPPAVYRSVDDGRHLVRMESPPTTAVYSVESSDDGTLVAFDDWRYREQQLMLWVRPAGGEWVPTPLPLGFRPEGISRSPDGTVYIVGGQLPNPLADSAVPHDLPRRPPPSGWATEAFVVLRGGEIELARPRLTDEALADIKKDWTSARHLKSVNAAGDPLVVFTTWGDNGHDCLLVVDELHWNVLPERLLSRKVIRERVGVVSVYKLDGRRFRTADRGRSWRADDLGPAIRAACPVLSDSHDPIVVDVDASGDTVVVAVRPWHRSESGGDWLLWSNDDGTSFTALAQSGKAANFQRVCLLAGPVVLGEEKVAGT